MLVSLWLCSVAMLYEGIKRRDPNTVCLGVISFVGFGVVLYTNGVIFKILFWLFFLLMVIMFLLTIVELVVIIFWIIGKYIWKYIRQFL